MISLGEVKLWGVLLFGSLACAQASAKSIYLQCEGYSSTDQLNKDGTSNKGDPKWGVLDIELDLDKGTIQSEFGCYGAICSDPIKSTISEDKIESYVNAKEKFENTVSIEISRHTGTMSLIHIIEGSEKSTWRQLVTVGSYICKPFSATIF